MADIFAAIDMGAVTGLVVAAGVVIVAINMALKGTSLSKRVINKA